MMKSKIKSMGQKFKKTISRKKNKARIIFSSKNKKLFLKVFFYVCALGAIINVYPAYAQEAGDNLTNVESMKPKKPSAILVFGFSLTCGIISGFLITVYLIQLHDAKLLRLYSNYIFLKYS